MADALDHPAQHACIGRAGVTRPSARRWGRAGTARLAGYTPAAMPTLTPSDHADDDRPGRHRGRQRCHAPSPRRPARCPKPMPSSAPASRERGRLDHELRQDIAAPGAERLPDPDLAGPLAHRHEHDVHDHDAADDERDGDQPGQRDEQDASRSSSSVPSAPSAVWKAKLFACQGLSWRRLRMSASVSPIAQLHRRPGRPCGTISASRMLIGQISRRAGCAERHDGELVEREAEQRALLRHDADDPVGQAADLHRLADRIDARRAASRPARHR